MDIATESRGSSRSQCYQAWADRFLIILFSIGIGLPLVGFLADRSNFASFDAKSSSGANRQLNGQFHWHDGLSSLLESPKKFEKFFNDHFGFRKHLVELCARVKVFGLGDTSNTLVIVGRDGWLYFGWDMIGHSARNPRPFSSTELQKWRTVLETRTEWLKKRDCQYLFVIAPEKESVYPEHLPARTRSAAQHTRTIQLMGCLTDDTASHVLDLGDSLRPVASQERLFHRTDTHWNDYGAFLAYSTIIQKLSDRFPGMEPLPPSRIQRSKNITPGRDLANTLALKNFFLEESFDIHLVDPQAKRVDENVEVTENLKMPWFQPAVWENTNRELPKAIVIGDSMTFALLPWLAENFSRLVYLNEHVLDPMVIEREQPDVIIQEVVERKLFVVAPEDPVCQPDLRLTEEVAKTIR